MNFFGYKMRVIKNNEENYILIKKSNLLLYFSVTLLILFLIKSIERMQELNYLFNKDYIGANTVAFLIFLLFFYKVLTFFSKETLEFKNKEIEIKKYLVFFCFYKRKISIDKITKINYLGSGNIIFRLMLTDLFFYDSNSIIIQANTGLEEDKLFYFGIGLSFKDYQIFCEIFRKITERERVNVYFLE
ncbi:MAG: hypothetical protein SOY60_08795 [Fusobacterium gastrosuis]|uniref:hypothetical protein n=1 Tax=Fusobacterium TaxID=848 RepID=UPI0025C32828|nr:hypothetical protein [Fusobacterium sp.]MCI7223187.1 hypothetical protein [Fusobacterium sp.]MDD7410893.1 hypothetical protein [Fusobacteriaceae bacterium]MDY4011752.1 hypothetical protein [Fusobacterium gastrosuis]MDY5713246.1 hypothetical protein [Fusobacterium gastrosuis]